MTQTATPHQARIVGFSPQAAIEAKAMEIMFLSADVQLNLGGCHLGDYSPLIHRQLTNIRRLAQGMTTGGSRSVAPESGLSHADEILAGYRADIRDLLEALVELAAPVLESSWPPGTVKVSDEQLRQIGMSAANLSRRIETYLTVSKMA